jgi:hypothetical protein
VGSSDKQIDALVADHDGNPPGERAGDGEQRRDRAAGLIDAWLRRLS